MLYTPTQICGNPGPINISRCHYTAGFIELTGAKDCLQMISDSIPHLNDEPSR